MELCPPHSLLEPMGREECLDLRGEVCLNEVVEGKGYRSSLPLDNLLAGVP